MPDLEDQEIIQAESQNDGEILAGKKRLRPLAINAVHKGEIDNSVEFAYLQRPYSPKNFRIYSDK